MNDQSTQIFVIESNPQMRDLLSRALHDYKLEHIEIVEEIPKGKVKTIGFGANSNAEFSIENPFYFASLLMAIERVQFADNYSHSIAMGAYTLDSTQSTVVTPNHKTPVKLTEKERDILIYLHDNYPHAVPKDELLENVWGYGAQIETHTLETHIYRLRQKIEKDSSKPEFLVTNDKGYTLAI